MNAELKKIKLDIKKVDDFIKKGKTPSEEDLKIFIRENELEELTKYAMCLLEATHISSYLQHTKKLNKYRP